MKNNNSKLIIQNSKLLFVLSLFLSLGLSCNTTEPPSNQNITLTFEDASCTEAWLNLKLENLSLPTEIEIIENDSTFLSTSINTNDTILFVENLQPSSNYTFIAKTNGLHSSVSSLRTMDTTSHNFTWEIFTFGGGSSSSYLSDVAIINENNIWAVGKIHTKDTDKFDKDSNWVQSYNAVHWDGNTWELKRIMFYTFCNQEHKAPYPAKSVFSFDDGVIAITSGSQITYIENGEQKNIECISVSVNSIWGISSKDFYVVGYGENISNYNGSSWSKMESGTDLSISSIYGTEEDNIKYCTPIFREYGIESYLLKLDKNNNISKEYLSTDRHFGEVWTKRGFPIYLSGDGTFTNKSGIWENALPENIYASSGIRGNDLNDIITCGSFGFLSHYNGVSWKTYPVMIENSYSSVSINDNVVAATSYTATIVVGRR